MCSWYLKKSNIRLNASYNAISVKIQFLFDLQYECSPSYDITHNHLNVCEQQFLFAYF